MERLKCLDWFQKGVLLILAAMTLLFAVLYPVVIGRVGYEYRDAVLIPRSRAAAPSTPASWAGLRPALPSPTIPWNSVTATRSTGHTPSS